MINTLTAFDHLEPSNGSFRSVGLRSRVCGEGRLPADSVEKQSVASAESCVLNSARAPF